MFLMGQTLPNTTEPSGLWEWWFLVEVVNLKTELESNLKTSQ